MENPGGQEGRKEFRIGLLGGLLALGRLLGLALRHNPELEQRVTHDHGEQGVDHLYNRKHTQQSHTMKRQHVGRG